MTHIVFPMIHSPRVIESVGKSPKPFLIQIKLDIFDKMRENQTKFKFVSESFIELVSFIFKINA